MESCVEAGRKTTYPIGPSPRRLTAFAAVSVAGAAAYAAAIAIPTAIIDNPLFHRMVPPTMWSWVFWILPAILFGPLVASYVVRLRPAACGADGATMGAGLLGYLAVGCPICNKVVVALMGIGGALTYFQPVQPLLGAASVALLAYGVKLRLFPPPGASAAAPSSL